MIQQITLEELEDWKAQAKLFHLVDVREETEHHYFNIGGRIAPLSELMQYKTEFDKPNPVIVYCKRGIRSQIAIQRLQNRLPQVQFYNLKGGILKLLLKHKQTNAQ